MQVGLIFFWLVFVLGLRIPERALLHLLNTGEYVEDREANTITVVVSGGEVYVLDVDDVWLSLKHFAAVMNERSDRLERGEDVGGCDGHVD